MSRKGKPLQYGLAIVIIAAGENTKFPLGINRVPSGCESHLGIFVAIAKKRSGRTGYIFRESDP
jgi:hypothetical protein